jgi:phenylpyruvate tautomerase PptA (4-oxalocrotonate tautomerase family)
MPMMDLTYPAGALSAESRTALVDELTTVLLRAERAPKSQLFRDIAWTYVHELPEGCVLAAGRPVEQPTFRLQVTIPFGALDDARKGELVENATGAILAAAGIDDPFRVWVLVNEVPDGNWGAGANVVRFEQLAQMAANERDRLQSAEPAPVAG